MMKNKAAIKCACIASLTAIVLGLAACGEPEVELSRSEQVYEVMAINPPKHFYVDLKNIKTGVVNEHVYISKHCNVWKQLPLHSRWVLTEVEYQRGDKYYTRIIGTRALCDDFK